MDIKEDNLSYTTPENKEPSKNLTRINPNIHDDDDNPEKKKKNSIMTRVITGIVMAVFAMPIVFLGDFFLFLFMCAGLVGAIWEIIRCGRIKYSIFMYITTYISAIFLMVMPLIKGLLIEDYSGRLFNHFLDIDFSPLIIFIVILALFITVLVDKNFTVREACFIFTMIIIIVFGMQSALYIRYIPNKLRDPALTEGLGYFNVFDNFYSAFFFIWVIMSGALSDIGGYLFGMLFGQTKMNERISPKKTWEGFFGGVAFSFAICTLIGLLIPAFTQGKICLLEGVLDLEHWYNILFLAMILPAVSVVGDFVFSSIKRFNGIKDYGSIFPGHGGILDRIDSLLFACMTAATYVYICQVFTGK